MGAGEFGLAGLAEASGLWVEEVAALVKVGGAEDEAGATAGLLTTQPVDATIAAPTTIIVLRAVTKLLTVTSPNDPTRGRLESRRYGAYQPRLSRCHQSGGRGGRVP
jgi:hypothetical protein